MRQSNLHSLPIGSEKIIATPYRVEVPVFVEKKVVNPILVDKQVEVPVGMERVVNDIAEMIKEAVLDKVEKELTRRIDLAVGERIREIEAPRIVFKEEVNVIYKDVMIDRAVIKDVAVTNAIITDKEVVNAVVRNVPVVNAVIEDIEVTNAIIKDVQVQNIIVNDHKVSQVSFKQE